MAVIRFAAILNPVLNHILQWASEFSLGFSYANCNYTVVSPIGRIDYAPSTPVRMNGHWIRFECCLVYLGTIDVHMSSMPHLSAVQERAFHFLYKMDCLTATNWGIKPNLRKVLYQVVTEPIILYAASIWYTGNVAEVIR